MRKGLFLLLQLAVTAAVLAYLFHDSQRRGQMAAALRTADLRWMALGVLVYSGVEALGAVRWRLLLRVQGFRVGWFAAARQLLTAIFFNLYSPALIGGDAARMYYLSGERPEHKPAGFSAILMDRIVGLASLLVIGALALALRYSWLTQSSGGEWLVRITALSILGSAAFVAMLIAISFGGWRAPRWLPLSQEVTGSLEGLRRYRRHLGICGSALLITIVAHLFYYLVYYCTARALCHGDCVIRVLDILAIMPIVNTLVALPVSISGIGVREVVFQTLLGELLGVEAGVAVLIASTGFLVYAFWGLVGGLFFLLYPPKQMQ